MVELRASTAYSHRVKDGESKPCAIIGVTRSKEGNVVYAEFQKTYKWNHSCQRTVRMT